MVQRLRNCPAQEFQHKLPYTRVINLNLRDWPGNGYNPQTQAKKGKRGPAMLSEYTLTGRIQENDGYIIMTCDDLPIGGFGRTEEEAFANLLHDYSLYMRCARSAEGRAAASGQGIMREAINDYMVATHFSYSIHREGTRSCGGPLVKS